MEFVVDFQIRLGHFPTVSANLKIENAPQAPDALALKLQRVYREYSSHPEGVLSFFKSVRTIKGATVSNHCHTNGARTVKPAVAKKG